MAQQATLFPDADPLPLTERPIGDRCVLLQDGDVVTVVLAGVPLMRFGATNRVDRRIAAALLADVKAAPVSSILSAFEMDDATLWRDRQRLHEGGVTAIARVRVGGAPGTTLAPAIARRVLELHEEGLSLRAVATRLAVTVARVRGVLDGRSPRKPAAIELVEATAESRPATEATTVAGPAVEVAPCVDTVLAVETAHVGADELVVEAETAHVGADELTVEVETAANVGADELAVEVQTTPALDVEAARTHAADETAPGSVPSVEGERADAPEFVACKNVPAAGLLLVLPALASTGLVENAHKIYGELRPGTYGLRATMLVLFFLALLRRPRPEALKSLCPESLGRLLGLERAPEVKTLRRKLAEIGERGKSYAFMRSMAARWLGDDDDKPLGHLYVDGHVRVYHGERKLPKAHVTQKNLCLRATTDYWVNDTSGRPIFVVTRSTNDSLTKMLPVIVEEIEQLANGRKGTLVFDRGGWNTQLFKELFGKGWHVLTYVKGAKKKHTKSSFTEHTGEIDGRKVSLQLSERTRRLRNGLKVRQIAELRDDGGQTLLVTTDFDEKALVLAHRLFQRWRQENYFRYMKENFALDALVDYGAEAADPTRDVPNPRRKDLDRQIKEKRAELAKLEQEYGEAAIDNEESARPTMRGFKIANGALGKQVRALREEIEALKTKRSSVPLRVPVGEVMGADAVVRLSPERKLFTDVVKAAAYRAESALLEVLRPHFPRIDEEGRAFLRNAVQQSGDLLVEGDTLVVRLAPMSAPRYTAALKALCARLNEANPTYLGSSYRLRYEVA